MRRNDDYDDDDDTCPLGKLLPDAKSSDSSFVPPEPEQDSTRKVRFEFGTASAECAKQVTFSKEASPSEGCPDRNIKVLRGSPVQLLLAVTEVHARRKEKRLCESSKNSNNDNDST